MSKKASFSNKLLAKAVKAAIVGGIAGGLSAPPAWASEPVFTDMNTYPWGSMIPKQEFRI